MHLLAVELGSFFLVTECSIVKESVSVDGVHALHLEMGREVGVAVGVLALHCASFHRVVLVVITLFSVCRQMTLKKKNKIYLLYLVN